MPPKKNTGAAKTSKGKSSEEGGGKAEKKGGSAVKVRNLSFIRCYLSWSITPQLSFFDKYLRLLVTFL